MTCITDFAENKRNESSQQSRTNRSNNTSPEYVVSEGESPPSNKFTLAELLSAEGSLVLEVSFGDSSSCLSFETSGAERLSTGVQKSIRLSNYMISVKEKKNNKNLNIFCVLDETCTCL